MGLLQKDDNYLADISSLVEKNRCPHCNVGMIIDSPYLRTCPRCNYSDSSNVPHKFKLRFSLHHDIENKGIVVVAKEYDGTISFMKEFVDNTTAEIYMDRLKPLCL